MVAQVCERILRVSFEHHGVPRGRAYFLEGDRPIRSPDPAYPQEVPTVIFDTAEAIGALADRCKAQGIIVVDDNAVKQQLISRPSARPFLTSLPHLVSKPA